MEHLKSAVDALMEKIWDESAQSFTREALGEFLRMDDPWLRKMAQREIDRRCQDN